jgi:pyruvate,orthophosphate dikinase
MRVVSWIVDFTDGSREMRDLLGGKGAGIAEMTRVLGAERVPAGFVITTAACVAYLRDGEPPEGLEEEVDEALERLERAAGKRLGDAADPLLVSVRSGARVSMPGMLDTVLNLGLTDEAVDGLERQTSDARFAWDSYRRLLQMFGNVVRGVPGSEFEDALSEARDQAGASVDTELGADELRALCDRFKRIVADAGEPFPQHPRDQLREAIVAVFESWNGDRARSYRRLERIPDDWGTAVNVQRMAFGNRGETSGSGVAFSRNETTGAPEPSGDYLANAQGEDVVAGIRNTEGLEGLRDRLPEVHAELLEVLSTLERHYGDMQDVEFTVEDGVLFLLQTRAAKRPAQASVRFACDAVAEGMLDRAQAIATIDADALDALLHPTFDREGSYDELARGVPASPGAAQGAIVFSAGEAVRRAGDGEDVILVRRFTEAEDVAGFHAARGILTAEGGKSSHAALVARGMGRPCVAGASMLEIDSAAGVLRVGETELHAGDPIAIDGSTGLVTVDEVELIAPRISDEFERVLEWADEIRRLGVRANADAGEDAERARSFGAEGIGLCRTEHMFFGEDREELVREMFIAGERWRRAKARSEGDETIESTGAAFRDSLDRLGELQRADFAELFRAMSGLPVTVRLLDPPLHEFLPVSHFEAALEEAGEEGEEAEEARSRLALARELQETNPMLGLRGIRLAVMFGEIYEMQAKAIVEAMLEVAGPQDRATVEIMLPLVAYETELALVRGRIVRAVEAALESASERVPYEIGTMIELPRACLVADRIAADADFFSFGTNDLTQTAAGLSRDDAEGGFLNVYLERGLLDRSPFESLDTPGVGALVEIAAKRGRETKADLSLGICGEHGGDPESIRFFERVGLDYVSCSPYRVPIARVAAAQAVLAAEDGES